MPACPSSARRACTRYTRSVVNARCYRWQEEAALRAEEAAEAMAPWSAAAPSGMEDADAGAAWNEEEEEEDELKRAAS